MHRNARNWTLYCVEHRQKQLRNAYYKDYSYLTTYKRQIYQIAESNRKNRFGSENRIESKLSFARIGMLYCLSRPYIDRCIMSLLRFSAVGLGPAARRYRSIAARPALSSSGAEARRSAANASSVNWRRSRTQNCRLCMYLTKCIAYFTRSSAIAEGPRDASYQLKSCQLPRNSAETTYTTTPDQVDGMKLEI